ncbi:MAG: DnaJ C-terminal domain-containing protein [Thermoanaerobaculia bacterium]|nr:DnaJ C-terminal domain-containing protein [Thermoanaerobaculia bacterium]
MIGDDDPYLILGLTPGAELGAIRRAYRRLARRHHPGLHARPEDAARFSQIVAAYRRLASCRLDLPPVEPAPLVARAFLFVSSPPAEILEAPRHGDRELVVELGFGEAIRGGMVSVTLQREQVCPACGGSGCADCGRRGVKVRLERLRVRFSPGVEDGTCLRLGRRSGDAGEPRQLRFKVRAHEYFQRSGLDISGVVPISYREAVLGAEIEVPTIEGPVRVRVPPGTRGGTRFRMAGRGVRTQRGVGDHYYTVEIAVPTSLSCEEEEWLRRLPERSPREGLPKAPV